MASKRKPHTPANNSTASQRQRVLRWLQSWKGLTALQGLYELNVLRLAARILELRAKGHQIITCWTFETTAEGCTHFVGQYFLVPSKQRSILELFEEGVA